MVAREVRSSGVASAPPDQVWQGIRDFCAPWHPAIDQMSRETDAAGHIIRAFTVQGEETTYREQLTYLSHSERVMAYSHLEGIAGARRYDARLTVTPSDAGGSVVSMSAQIEAPAPRADEIAQGTQWVFDTGIEAVCGMAVLHLQPGAPYPSTKTTLETHAIDNLPRLALTTTSEGSDTLVLFLHGIGGQRSNWEAQLHAIAPHARAASIDLRGYGDSTLGSDQSTVDDYCADIARVAEVLGARKLILCGLSYGAWIATSFAMRHPDRLAGLVLSGGCTGMSEAGPDERDAFRVSREVPLDAGQSPRDFAPGVVKVIAGPDASDAVRAELLASMQMIPAETYRDALRCFTNPLETFDFTRLTMPVLLMTGAHDVLAPPHEIKRVAERIWDASPQPDVQFEVIADAGHVCNLEAPQTYNATLVPFVQRLA